MKNANNNIEEAPAVNADGLSVIKDILLGQHLAEYKSNLNSIKKQFEDSGKASGSQMKQLESNINSRIDQLEKSFEKSIRQLESMIDKQVSKLNQRIDEVSSTDKKDLANMLSTISQKLVDGK